MPDTPRAEADPERRYANHFQIGFNAYEVVIDFGQEFPPDPEIIHTRIVMSTVMARNLSELLEQALGDYDRKFGTPQEGQ